MGHVDEFVKAFKSWIYEAMNLNVIVSIIEIMDKALEKVNLALFLLNLPSEHEIYLLNLLQSDEKEVAIKFNEALEFIEGSQISEEQVNFEFALHFHWMHTKFTHIFLF